MNALRAFEAAARHSSFTRAAAELFVTHAAVSRHVRHLEAWLDNKLFVRKPTGVELTEAGERYRRALTPLFDALLAATRSVMRQGTASLTISVEVAFATRWLVPRLVKFQRAHPEIELSLDPTNEPEDFSGEAELAVRWGQGTWRGVEAIHLIELRGFPVCSPALIEGEPPLVPDDLARFTLLHEETKEWWGHWLAAAGAGGVQSHKGPMFSDEHFALLAAEAGQGFALGDTLLAADALRSGRLVRPFAVELPGDGYYLVYPEGHEPSEAALAFRAWLDAELEPFRTTEG